MFARDLMTPCTVVCTQHTNLRDTAHLMIENHCGCLPVVEDDDPARTIIGVVSEHDLTCRVIAEGLDPVMSTVWLAMTMPAEIVHGDTTMEECRVRLRQRQTTHLVVVDHDGSCCGIITQGDIARQCHTAIDDRSSLADISRRIWAAASGLVIMRPLAVPSDPSGGIDAIPPLGPPTAWQDADGWHVRVSQDGVLVLFATRDEAISYYASTFTDGATSAQADAQRGDIVPSSTPAPDGGPPS